MSFDLPQNLTDNLKSVDPDRYRAALFADRAPRHRLLTLYAFHAELAKVPELVSEPMVGAIRYQWWRDAVEEIYAKDYVRKHEVNTPLRTVLLEAKTPRFWIDQLIDGRERDLDPRPFEDLDAAKDYCAATSGKLMQIAVQLSAPDMRLTAKQTDGVHAAGLAWGLTGLARSFGYYQKGMLSKLDYEDICGAAKTSHEEAKGALGTIDAAIMPALAYAALTPGFLKRLARIDPMKQAVSYGGLRKRAALMGAVLRGRV